jgi:hypothetical protein
MGDKRQGEPRAGLLIDAACEPLVAALENPPEKPAIVNLRVTHAGKGINMGARQQLRSRLPQRFQWRLCTRRQLLFEAIHHRC